MNAETAVNTDFSPMYKRRFRGCEETCHAGYFGRFCHSAQWYAAGHMAEGIFAQSCFL